MGSIKKHKKGKRTYLGAFIIFIILCIFIAVFPLQYYNSLRETLREENNGYLQEISRHMGSNIDRIVDDNYANLHMLASTLENFSSNSIVDFGPIVAAQKENWDYRHILLITEDGTAYRFSGEESSLGDNSFFDQVILQGEPGAFTTQIIDNKEYIMFTVPMNLTAGGKKFVALAASYEPGEFGQTLSISSFSGQAYSCVIGGEGTVIVRSAAETKLKLGYNVITTISESKLDSGSDINKMKSDMQDNLGGQIIFTQNDERYYLVYTPVSGENWYLLTFVPTWVVNEKSELMLRLTLVLCGMIIFVFAILVSLLMLMFYRNKNNLEHMAFVDSVTGGNTIQRFYELAEASLNEPDRPTYGLIYTNLEKFKVLNEQLGRSVCNDILRELYSVISANLRSGECVGRLSADNFCVLMRYDGDSALIRRFEQWFESAREFSLKNKPVWALPSAEFGVYIIDDSTKEFPLMIDRAKLALREYPHRINSKLRYAIYDDKVRRRLIREKQIEDMMEESLKNGEFKVYLQPKYNVLDRQIGGAEALARWVPSSGGMIYPDEFIPLFEKNGFVVQLDRWVFKEVCRHIRLWLDLGFKPLKISVNCSRVHLNDENFLNSYREIAAEYKIPQGLLEIELTESIVMEDAQRLSRVIDEIHEAGFGCSMDDFGSGYSSLNLVQSIPVDTLKLDKIFFRQSVKNPERMESVVKSIVTMAKALSMVTVAEGVEYPEQVEMLARIGCEFIQGYVFAKPMPISDFEELAFKKKEEPAGVAGKD